MKKLIEEKGSGKTTAVIEQAHETGAYIIVISDDEARRVAVLAEEMGKSIRYPVTIGEFLRGGMRGSRVKNIIIDNLDLMIRRICAGLDVELITMTKE